MKNIGFKIAVIIFSFFMLIKCENSDFEFDSVLDLSDESIERITSNTYSPSCLYSSSTLKIFNIKNENAVVTVGVNSNLDDTDNLFLLKVLIFDEEETASQISKYVNNLHSDGVYEDTAEPIATYIIPKEYVSLKSQDTEKITGCDGNTEYNKINVELEISEHLKSNKYLMKDFKDNIDVYQKIETSTL